MNDQLHADLAWLLAKVERSCWERDVLEHCEVLRERYAVGRGASEPDTLQAIRAAEDVLKGIRK